MLSRILQTLLPPHCVLCSRPSLRPRNLCLACEQDLPIITQFCSKMEWFPRSSRGTTHLSRDAALFTLYPYQPPITKLITGLKFEYKLSYALALGELMADKIPDWYRGNSLPNIIIPVPLHPLRMQERGFNQALEIARPISKKLSISIDYLGTRRIKHTARQSDLPAKKRRENIKQAFSCDKDYTSQHIAIIDDVYTTGQTVREFAEVLCKSGAKQVDVWCCARV